MNLSVPEPLDIFQFFSLFWLDDFYMSTFNFSFPSVISLWLWSAASEFLILDMFWSSKIYFTYCIWSFLCYFFAIVSYPFFLLWAFLRYLTTKHNYISFSDNFTSRSSQYWHLLIIHFWYWVIIFFFPICQRCQVYSGNLTYYVI